MHDGDAAVVGGGGEARHVGDHPASHRHDGVGAGQPPTGKAPAQLLHRGQALGPLTLTDQKGLPLDAGVDGHVDRGLGDHGGAGDAGRHDLEQTVTGAGTDQHLVRPGPEGDRDADHRRASDDSAASSRSTTVTGASRSTSTTT